MSVTTTITPDSSYAIASPQFGIDIYPQSGDTITLTGAQVLSAEVNKNIRDAQGGKFRVMLPPGGPTGVGGALSWTNIISPNSFAVIYMSRGNSKRIVMLGIVTNISEQQQWTGQKVTRVIQLEGLDFTYYFSMFSYYTMPYLGLIQSQTLGSVAGYIAGLFGKLLAGSPVTVGQIWLADVMLGVGKNTAVLENTFIYYKGASIPLYKIFAYWLEPISELGSVAYVPFLCDVMNSEGPWWDKLLDIFTWPYYEFFVMTANASTYPQITTAAQANTDQAGFGFVPAQPFSVNGYDPVYPIIVARVNPLPWVSVGPTATTTGNISMNRWNALPIYSLGNYGFIESRVEYNTNEVNNFFSLVTTDSRMMADASSSNGVDANTFSTEFGVILDRASINTYGFRPNFATLKWLTYLNPFSAVQSEAQLDNLLSILLGKLASYYTPTPLMLNAVVTMPLWLDVMPGCRFTYFPFKGGPEYMFYIEGVSHTYEFGGRSYTTLTLARGLQTSEWTGDTQTLVELHLNNLVRQGGKLVTRPNITSAAGSTFFSPKTIANLQITMYPYFIATRTTPPSTSSGP